MTPTAHLRPLRPLASAALPALLALSLSAQPSPPPLTKAGDAIDALVASNQPRLLPLTLNAGQFFFAQINGIRVSIRLLHPSGDAPIPASRTVALVVSQSGLYQLEVRTAAPVPQRFKITALQWREARPGDDNRVQAIAALTEGYRQMETATAAGRRLALHHYSQAKAASTVLQDPWLEARCLLAEAGAHAALGAVPSAIAAYTEAARLYLRIADFSGHASALNLAALLLAASGDHDQAFANYNRALEYYRSARLSRAEAEVLRNVAIAHHSAGNFQSAIDIYSQVLDRFRSISDNYGLAVTLVQLGELYISLGDFESGIAHSRAAIPLHQAHADITAQVHSLTNIGEALAAQRRHSEALDSLNSAIRLAGQSGLGWQHVHAKAIAAVSEQALGRLDRARLLLEESLPPMRAHGNLDGASRVLTQLGLLHLQARRFPQAAAALDDALHLAHGLQNPAPRAHALTALARLARAQNNLPLATSHAEQALAIVESVRTRVDNNQLRAMFLASRGSWYEFYIDLLMSRNDPHAAFAASERARARSLLDMLLHNRAAPAPSTPAFLPHSLEPGAAILQYQLGENRSWLFIVTNSGVSARQLPPAAVIEADVRRLRSLLSLPARGSLGPYVQAAERLFRLSVAPALPLIANKQKLIIVPDGALHYLPFEALLTAPPSALDFSRLPYLLHRWTVGYAPSAAAYSALRLATRPPGGHDLVAFGDPRGDLPGAAREIQEIAKPFPNRALLFQGFHASSHNLTSSTAAALSRRVHIAAHATIREGSPATSAILLASGSRLAFSDVLSLRWNADLVVLSGCDTGVGPLLRGEGIQGFLRAFLLAGARNVAVSLWPVHDESTALLMASFYRQLGAGGPNAGSLRHAKLSMIRAGPFAHPYYWAPFILSGQI